MVSQPAVTVRVMTQDEFEAWSGSAVEAYAQELARATGQPVEEMLERARRQHAELLPDGPSTERMWLMRVADGDRVVGTLWVGRHPERADLGFVWDVEIEPDQRGHGYGRATMLAAEQLLADAGYQAVGLNVFGDNTAARALYGSLGYREVAVQMVKPLDGG